MAERSRLRHEGLLEVRTLFTRRPFTNLTFLNSLTNAQQPHQTHEAVINFDDEHREVAQGREVRFDNDGEGAGRSV